MNIRITAATDKIKKISSILNMLDIENNIYNNRGTQKTKRLYANIDDREADKQLDNLSSMMNAQLAKKIKG